MLLWWTFLSSLFTSFALIHSVFKVGKGNDLCRMFWKARAKYSQTRHLFDYCRHTDYIAVCIEFHFYLANIKRHDTHLKLFAFFCHEAERALLLYYFRLK